MKSRIMGLALYVAHMGWKRATVHGSLVENRKNESAKSFQAQICGLG